MLKADVQMYKYKQYELFIMVHVIRWKRKTLFFPTGLLPPVGKTRNNYIVSGDICRSVAYDLPTEIRVFFALFFYVCLRGFAEIKGISKYW